MQEDRLKDPQEALQRRLRHPAELKPLDEQAPGRIASGYAQRPGTRVASRSITSVTSTPSFRL
jgi:hypothetical protein